jgi:hypothetical protein
MSSSTVQQTEKHMQKDSLLFPKGVSEHIDILDLLDHLKRFKLLSFQQALCTWSFVLLVYFRAVSLLSRRLNRQNHVLNILPRFPFSNCSSSFTLGFISLLHFWHACNSFNYPTEMFHPPLIRPHLLLQPSGTPPSLSLPEKARAFLSQQRKFLKERQLIIEQARADWKKRLQELDQVGTRNL